MKYQFQNHNQLIRVENLVLGLEYMHPKDFFFSGELHDFWELLLVVSGHATATADERVYDLKPGSLICHKPLEYHRFWSTDNSPLHVKIISFQASGPILDFYKNKCLELNRNSINAFHKICNTFIQATYQCNDGKNAALHDYTASLAASSLECFLLELTTNPSYKEFSITQNEQQFMKIVNTMNEHCNENISIDEIAQLCNMSISNLKRIFKYYSNQSPAKYFLTLKIRKAMQLMETNMTSTQIAYELGFSEPCYFYSVFKRETGMTPKEFRMRDIVTIQPHSNKKSSN